MGGDSRVQTLRFVIRGAVVALAVIALCGCTADLSGPQIISTAPASRIERASSWPIPNPQLTPGAVETHCTFPRPQSQRNVPLSEKQAIDAAYHYHGKHGLAALEYDHLIPFSLCGSNSSANVWPEIYDGVRVSTYVHNYKDQLESTVYLLVRNGRLTLQAGQDLFRADWRHEWCQLVHRPGVICDI